MSLTFNQVKHVKPLCKINGSKYNGQVIYIDPNINEMDSASNFKHLRIPNTATFQMIPDSSHERDVYYVCGPSGSGKSYFVREYCKQYKKKFKDNEVYVFSNLKEDPTLDVIKLKRFKLDSSLYEDPLPVENLKGSCVIFDDTDCISDKKIKNAVVDLLNQCLEVGRHYKITVLITFHLPSDRHTTRKMLNECHYFVYFPHSCGNKIRYVLSNYLDIDEKQMKYFKRLNSRFICIRKNFPLAYVSEHEVGLLNVDSDDEPTK